MTQGLPLADELSADFARVSGLLLTQETVRTSLQLVAQLTRTASYRTTRLSSLSGGRLPPDASAQQGHVT